MDGLLHRHARSRETVIAVYNAGKHKPFSCLYRNSRHGITISTRGIKMKNERPTTDAPIMEDELKHTDDKTSEQAERQERRPLTPEAQRALAEAEERRRQADMAKMGEAKELGGRDGPDPVRYGDWENSGIVSDF